ncbi:MAG TPA: VOC family protein [Dehalococcoidia bacterium]
MAVSQLGYIGVGVSDTGAWERFAEQVLGMQVGERREDGIVYLRMDEYHHRVILHPSGEDDILYTGFQASTRGEYEEAKAALRRLGASVVQGTKEEIDVRRVVDFVHFESGGLRFELSFGPAIVYASPFKPGRALSGFKTGELGMGHIVLRPNEVEPTVKLLMEALGFRLSDYVFTMTFLHCNPRHHTVALQQHNPSLPSPANKRMWHFMLETDTLDDVGLAFDAATNTETPPATTIGKHMNDHMVSFYVTTPSGFEIEYGWNGRLIDDSTWQVVRHVSGDIWGHKPMRPQQAAPPAAAAAPAAAASR